MIWWKRNDVAVKGFGSNFIFGKGWLLQVECKSHIKRPRDVWFFQNLLKRVYIESNHNSLYHETIGMVMHEKWNHPKEGW